jgi:hypothetical protein
MLVLQPIPHFPRDDKAFSKPINPRETLETWISHLEPLIGISHPKPKDKNLAGQFKATEARCKEIQKELSSLLELLSSLKTEVITDLQKQQMIQSVKNIVDKQEANYIYFTNYQNAQP